MAKIEYNPENCRELAEYIVDSMDVNDLISCMYDQHEADFLKNKQYFIEQTKWYEWTPKQGD